MSVQLDLFLDSRAVTLANEAIGALSARDGVRALAGLDRLRREAPDHPALSALETLTGALAGWREPDRDPAAIVRTVQRLDDEITPAAERALGPAARAFVRGFFHDLAGAARGLAYEPAYAAAHRASLCLRCGEWADAEEAARAIPGSNRNPDALHWLCVARYRRYGLAAARSALFALAWQAPQRLPSLLAELGDELLERGWQAFERASEWESVPESELPAWFPAWYLLEHPVAGKELDQVEFPPPPAEAALLEHPALGASFTGVELPDLPAAEAARVLLDLLELERRGDQRRLVAKRARLRELNPELFALYMASRATRYL